MTVVDIIWGGGQCAGGGFRWRPAHSLSSIRIDLCFKILIIYREFDLKFYFLLDIVYV